MNRFDTLKARYTKELAEKILPFWTTCAIDDSGAINNYIRENGEVINRDRNYWGLGRALWSFSAAYNDFQQNSEWLQIAINLFRYICRYGFDSQDNCVYLTDAEGQVKLGAVSIHSDAFVLYGMGEYYRATGDPEAKAQMLRIYRNTAAKLMHPETIKTFPFDTPPGLRAHSVHMVFAHVYYKTGVYLGNEEIKIHGIKLAKELFALFYNGQKDALMEYCVHNPDLAASHRKFLEIYNFGHGIEAMWFLMDIFSHEHDDSFMELILYILRSNLERGWDHKYGGLLLHARLRGLKIDYSACPDKKPSWSHNEAMVATLYAYLLTGDEYWLRWHQQLDEFTFRVFPNQGLEWSNWFNRSCTHPIPAQKNLEVKCIFHTSRALLMQILLCDAIMKKSRRATLSPLE